MRDIPVSEDRALPSEMLAAVGNGEQFIIARRGVAVARFGATVPAAAPRSQPNPQRNRVPDAFGALERSCVATALEVPLRRAIDQGRDAACPSTMHRPSANDRG